MKDLSANEVKTVSGGFFWVVFARIAVSSLINMGVYAATKKHRREEITKEGLAIAAGSGVVAGGIGGLGGAGGGLVGNAVWIPRAQALNASGNASGNAIAQKY